MTKVLIDQILGIEERIKDVLGQGLSLSAVPLVGRSREINPFSLTTYTDTYEHGQELLEIPPKYGRLVTGSYDRCDRYYIDAWNITDQTDLETWLSIPPKTRTRHNYIREGLYLTENYLPVKYKNQSSRQLLIIANLVYWSGTVFNNAVRFSENDYTEQVFTQIADRLGLELRDTKGANQERTREIAGRHRLSRIFAALGLLSTHELGSLYTTRKKYNEGFPWYIEMAQGKYTRDMPLDKTASQFMEQIMTDFVMAMLATKSYLDDSGLQLNLISVVSEENAYRMLDETSNAINAINPDFNISPGSRVRESKTQAILSGDTIFSPTLYINKTDVVQLSDHLQKHLQYLPNRNLLTLPELAAQYLLAARSFSEM